MSEVDSHGDRHLGMGACPHDWPMTGLVRQAPVTTTDYDDPVTTKNNSITSDFWIISGVVLQIFCIFLVSLSTFYYLCGINTFIYVRENIKIAGN